MRRLACAIALLTATACETLPPEALIPQQTDFGPERSFTGVVGFGLERQSFDDCWLDLSVEARADLARLAPSPALADERMVYAADVTLIGRRRSMINMEYDTGTSLPFGPGYGHLGLYECEVKAARILSARLREP